MYFLVFLVPPLRIWKLKAECSFSLGICLHTRPQRDTPHPLFLLAFFHGERAGICLKSLGEGFTYPSGGFHKEAVAEDERKELKKQKREKERKKSQEITRDREKAVKYIATYTELGLSTVWGWRLLGS